VAFATGLGLADYIDLTLAIATIALPALGFCLCFALAILTQRTTDIVLLVCEFAFLIAPNIPLVTLIRLDQFTLTFCHATSMQ
jgi:hypothetical protein